jgi:hypothetical protein
LGGVEGTLFSSEVAIESFLRRKRYEGNMSYRTQMSAPENPASLKMITTTKPMSAEEHARVMQAKAERRRWLEEMKDDQEVERSCYGYDLPPGRYR